MQNPHVRARYRLIAIIACLIGYSLSACLHHPQDVAQLAVSERAISAVQLPQLSQPQTGQPLAAKQRSGLKSPVPPIESSRLRDIVKVLEPGPSLVKAFCHQIAAKLDSVRFADCWDMALSPTGHYSVRGQPILQKVFLPKPRVTPLGRVTIVGGTHGDEHSSVAIVFKWLQTLQKYHSGLFHWTVVPLLNPDGALRQNPTRVNANGVDLNRNLPTSRWVHQSQKYWQRVKRSPRYYPGDNAASEPETRWLVQHIQAFQPDVIISVHSPHDLVDYDAPDRHRAPRRIGMLKQNFLGPYPGSLGTYAGLQNGIPVITLELPHTLALPKPNQIKHMWIDLVRWLKRNVHSAQKQRLAKFGQSKDG